MFRFRFLKFGVWSLGGGGGGWGLRFGASGLWMKR